VKFGAAEMEKIGFARGEDLLDGCVLRMPKAYPAYFGTYDRLGEIREWSDTISNLFMVGRNGMHRYNNQDHSMLTAMLAVDNIAEGRTDKANLWDVNLEMIYHEEKDLRVPEVRVEHGDELLPTTEEERAASGDGLPSTAPSTS
jgi:hypothetical protein